MTKSTVLQFGARPGQRRPPELETAPRRILGKIKKITTQQGKVEIILVSENVTPELIGLMTELQQLGPVYAHFEEAPPDEDGG